MKDPPLPLPIQAVVTITISIRRECHTALLQAEYYMIILDKQ